MKIKPLSEYSTEELTALEKKQKAMFYMNLAIFALLVGVTIYGTMKKGVDFFTFFPLFFLPLQFAVYLPLKKTRDELKSRNH